MINCGQIIIRLTIYFCCSLLLFGCVQVTSSPQKASDRVFVSKNGGVNATGIASTTVFSSCEISLGELYLWRDWQPVVGNPGPDDGSPLRVAVVLRIVNVGDTTQQVAWDSYLKDMEGTLYPVQFTDRSQVAQHSVTLAPGEIYATTLIAHDGPYLPIGSKASVSLRCSPSALVGPKGLIV